MSTVGTAMASSALSATAMFSPARICGLTNSPITPSSDMTTPMPSTAWAV